MRAIKKSTVALILATVCCLPVFAEDYDFIHFSKENGLAFNSIRSMTQDNRGVMWVGTYNGLNTYDGQRFRTTVAATLNPPPPTRRY